MTAELPALRMRTRWSRLAPGRRKATGGKRTLPAAADPGACEMRTPSCSCFEWKRMWIVSVPVSPFDHGVDMDLRSSSSGRRCRGASTFLALGPEADLSLSVSIHRARSCGIPARRTTKCQLASSPESHRGAPLASRGGRDLRSIAPVIGSNPARPTRAVSSNGGQRCEVRTHSPGSWMLSMTSLRWPPPLRAHGVSRRTNR